jgi:spermidine synthase
MSLRNAYHAAIPLGATQMTKVSRLGFALLVLFVLSGFAGLIYQSIWTHYLGLTLGHAAYAQTLVLAIYMGGMAVGAWLASRYTLRWKRLILGYALVEGVIGIFGLAFHPLFVAYTGFSQEAVLPGLSSPGLAHAYQWLSAALLILPQSILLGATFPLMSAGLIRAMPNEHGEVLGGLYFSNSLGAALGALLATFVLLPAVGLPGAVLAAGMINILVGIGAWGVSKMLDDATAAVVPSKPQADAAPAVAAKSSDEARRLGRVLLWATGASGAASFVYEIGWVRLLNQALGSTIHSFELMLAAFILGLAFGGLWIRKRARDIFEPVRYVGYVQVLMAIAALVSIPVFTQSFHWVGWIMGALSRSSSGYTLYELATAAISMLVMFPAAFLAGMTLPLFTIALLRAGAGERSIGRIYAANTLGAIVGVALAMHVLIPLIGVRLAVTLAALMDGLIGLYLLRVINPARLSKTVAAAALTMVAAVVFSLLLGRPDPLQQVAGVYRTGLVRVGDATVNYLRDGKTATVSMVTRGKMTSIVTNGKPDASLKPMREAPTADEITMIMAGVLPLALHSDPKRFAVIGWGSGLTTHTILGSNIPKVVDTIEIERAMVEGAKLYGDRVVRAYTDPRSKVHIDDARTFFSTGARQYDAIISEPSNPWVSGVAALFTQEFYAFLKRHLNEGGMLVQWLHLYELDDELLGTMLAAVAAEFPYTEMYLTNSADLLIVARMTPIGDVSEAAFPAGAELRAEMSRVGLSDRRQFALRRIGGDAVFRNFIRMEGSTPHSDYFPTVSLQAPRTRFMEANSTFFQDLVINGMPVLDLLECRRPLASDLKPEDSGHSTLNAWHRAAVAMARAGRKGAIDDELRKVAPTEVNPVQALFAVSQRLVDQPGLLSIWSVNVASFARGTVGLLPAEELAGVWIAPVWLPDSALEVTGVGQIMAAYSAAARRSPREMRVNAEAVLTLPGASLSPDLREQMLVLAMLGALGTDDKAAVAMLDARWGPTLGNANSFASIRRYLLAWAAGPTQACTARSQQR